MVSRGLAIGIAAAVASSGVGWAQSPTAEAERFGFGRPATRAEITAWDTDVDPDGAGLPPGRGTAHTGAPVYARLCASCHGRDGEGGSAAPLVGGVPEATPPFGPRYEAWRGDREDVAYTVGNYWPFATTLYDYIQRAMPSNAPGSLASDQVYGLVAWLLARNGIIGDDTTIDAATLPAVEMPAREIFVLPDQF